ncbi:hypothetical protein [Actinoallomurus sp. NPDC050550]|uniref:hypothetical protein n=1 Tax=Actinoallomurus sp. NPDC050550 TaxID=3154937 RepID=UPI0033CF3DEF
MKRTLILGGLTAITSAVLIGGAASSFAGTGHIRPANTAVCITPVDGGPLLVRVGPAPADPKLTLADPKLTLADPVLTPADPVLTPADPVLTPADPVLTPADPVLTAVPGKPSKVRPGTAIPIRKPVSGANCGTTDAPR